MTLKVCRWCHEVIWPWQRKVGMSRYWLHKRCAAAVNRMVERDDEWSEVSTGV